MTRKKPPAAAASPKRAELKLPLWKYLLFCALIVGVFVGLSEGVLALFHVRPIVATEDPYLGFVSYLPLYVEENPPDGSVWMVTAENKLRLFNKQRFPKHKPPGSYRVFALGASTTFGHPYDDTTSFSGWLREILSVAAPQHPWEVINAGGVSYASYRIAALMKELVQYSPDLFIVYTGENEFLERRTYQGVIDANPGVTWLNSLASRTRTYAALRSAIAAVRPSRSQKARGKYEMTGEVDALLDVAGGLDLYRRDDALQQQIAQHYAFNLHRIVQMARAAGAQVLFVTPAANLRDCSPFKSEHTAGLGSAAIARDSTLLAQGQNAHQAHDLPAALAALEQAVAIDPRYAAAQYGLGQVQFELGREADAAASFQRALDEDVCTLRQPTLLRDALATVAQEEHAPRIDFPALLQDSTFAITGHRIPGHEYFLDHLHPTIAGNRILAVALVDQMSAAGIAQPAVGWKENVLGAVTQTIESRVDTGMQVYGLRNLAMVFNWAGKKDEALRLAAQIRALEPQDAVNLVMQGRQASTEGRHEDAIRYYRQAVALDANHLEARCNLAIELSRSGKDEEALAEYQTVLKGWPDQWLVHIDAAYSYLKLGQYDQAIAHYKKVVELKPHDPRALVTLAAAYAATRHKEDAVRTADQAIAAARATGDNAMADQLQAMLADYKSGKEWDPRMGISQP